MNHIRSLGFSMFFGSCLISYVYVSVSVFYSFFNLLYSSSQSLMMVCMSSVSVAIGSSFTQFYWRIFFLLSLVNICQFCYLRTQFISFLFKKICSVSDIYLFLNLQFFVSLAFSSFFFPDIGTCGHKISSQYQLTYISWVFA